MFEYCADPASLAGFKWLSCYLTTGKHMGLYWAVGTVLLLLAITAPAALLFGFGGAAAARSHFRPLSWFGKGYIAIVRGVPDIAFFLFFFIIKAFPFTCSAPFSIFHCFLERIV